MKRVRVNGEVYVTSPLSHESIIPGALVRGRESRRVYRIICEDGDELIMRNVRHPDIVEAIETSYIMENCWVLVPESTQAS